VLDTLNRKPIPVPESGLSGVAAPVAMRLTAHDREGFWARPAHESGVMFWQPSLCSGRSVLRYFQARGKPGKRALPGPEPP
jgi:hypothetical protein